MSAARPGPPATERVGPYRLLAKIGEGGMGVVHLAQGDNGTRVALKVLRPHVVGDEEARERLVREVASLRRVSSPRVAGVLDADPWARTPYVATRYVPGLSLHQHVRQKGPLRGSDLGWFVSGLAEAVAAIHAVGVLHRDIKPSNVLLEGRSPVLIDFGLARLAEDPRLTLTGFLLGTPGYLAPEVLYGEDATTATDVHAWAATVVFASTGRPPFGTGPAVAIMDRVRRGEHDLSGVPAGLAPLVRQALAADPTDRPSTGAVVAAVAPRQTRSTPRQARSAAGPPGPDEVTMPWPLARSGAGSEAEAITRVEDRVPLPASATTRLNVPGPTPPGRSAPGGVTATSVEAARRPGAVRLSRLQRTVLLLELLGLCAVGTALAPYLALVCLALLVLTVRTVSWTGEAARERQDLRGRRRWYDLPLTALSTPWYLLVAAGGTVMLVLWAGLVTGVVAVVWAVAGPLTPGLLVLGGLLGLTLWWGPGAARLRRTTHRGLGLLVVDPRVGWTVVAALALVVGALVWSVPSTPVSWTPYPGPPWRPGTALHGLVAWF